jgi:thioredoxin 1
LPDIEALRDQYGDRVKFIKLNTSGARRLAISQKVLGLPTVILYRDGQKLSELTKDEAVKTNIEAMIKTALA